MKRLIIGLVKDHVSIVNMKSNERFVNSNLWRLGNEFWSLSKNPMDLLNLLAIYFKCSPKFNLSSKNIPKCFRYGLWITFLLLNIKSGWLVFLILQEKITSWACLEGSELKLVFHWYAQLLIFDRSLFKILPDKVISRTTKKREVSSAKSLEFEGNLDNKLEIKRN